jgi:hypothetical protein
MAIDQDPNLPERQDVQDNSAHMRKGLERDGLQPSTYEPPGGNPHAFEPEQVLGQDSFSRCSPGNMGGFATPAAGGWPPGRFAGWISQVPFNLVDMEEHMRFTATIEEEFANYLTEFPPVYLENDEREENVKKAIRMGVAMARNLREFVIAQMTEHLATTQHKHDPFFSHHRMPLLIPITETTAAEKTLETIPFSQYHLRLTSCFPNFSTSAFMHLIVAFGPALKVGVSVDENTTREHYVILPDAKQLVEILIKQVTHLSQVNPSARHPA